MNEKKVAFWAYWQVTLNRREKALNDNEIGLESYSRQQYGGLMDTAALRLLGKKKINNGDDNKNHQDPHEFRLVHFRGIFYTNLDQA